MLKIYTDGACKVSTREGAWAGILLYTNGYTRKKVISGTQSDTTNNRMELTAIIFSLRELKRKVTPHIFTDSKYCIGVLMENNNITTNHDLVNEGRELVKYYMPEFYWVKGHSGNQYNEEADYICTSLLK